jgi:hypothetical protein
METMTNRDVFTFRDDGGGITPKQLAATAKHVAACASPDQARGTLAGVLIESGENAVTMTATDSYRLVHAVIPCDGVPAFDPVIVEAKTLSKLPTFVKNESAVSFTAGDGFASFVHNVGGVFPVPVLSGTFADYRRLIPGEDAYAWPATGETVAFDPVLFGGLIDSVGGIVGASRSRQVPVRIVNMSAMKLTAVRATSGDGIDVTGLIMPLRQ